MSVCFPCGASEVCTRCGYPAETTTSAVAGSKFSFMMFCSRLQHYEGLFMTCEDGVLCVCFPEKARRCSLRLCGCSAETGKFELSYFLLLFTAEKAALRQRNEKEKEKSQLFAAPQKVEQFQREIKRIFYFGWRGVLRLLFLIYSNGSLGPLGVRCIVGFCDAGALLAVGVYVMT